MTCGFEMHPWIRNSSLSNYCFNFSRLILSHCTSLSQVALFWLLASLDLSRYGFQLSSTRFDSKQYGLLQSNQYRFAAKQAVQFCCKASSTGRFAAKQAVQVCCNASCKASSTGLLQSKVCCKARSTGLLQSKKHRFAAKQEAQVCCKASSTGRGSMTIFTHDYSPYTWLMTWCKAQLCSKCASLPGSEQAAYDLYHLWQGGFKDWLSGNVSCYVFAPQSGCCLLEPWHLCDTLKLVILSLMHGTSCCFWARIFMPREVVLCGGLVATGAGLTLPLGTWFCGSTGEWTGQAWCPQKGSEWCTAADGDRGYAAE